MRWALDIPVAANAATVVYTVTAVRTGSEPYVALVSGTFVQGNQALLSRSRLWYGLALRGPLRTMPQEHVRSLMTKSVFMLALAVFALMSAAQAQDDLISIGKRMTLRSEVLQEERSYWVYVPASYDDSAYPLQRYPVLYLLDGDAHFHSASGIVQFMSAGTNGNIQIPELIIVAIPNTNRTRDLTPSHATTWLDGNYAPYLEASGGGEKFLRFLQEELFAHIESRYRTPPTEFSWATLLEASSRRMRWLKRHPPSTPIF